MVIPSEGRAGVSWDGMEPSYQPSAAVTISPRSGRLASRY
jgi:hypothetical protein